MHRPERWGVVQFSTAAPGSAAYRPDPSLPARHLLHRVYYAQRDYRKARGKWASSLADLGLADLASSGLGELRLETTATSYEATLTPADGGEKQRRWHIRSDSRVWAE